MEKLLNKEIHEQNTKLTILFVVKDLIQNNEIKDEQQLKRVLQFVNINLFMFIQCNCTLQDIYNDIREFINFNPLEGV